MSSPDRVVVVGDSHLGSADPKDEDAFHEFLDAVPELGNRLLIMGDLFDFWFEYRTVVPRRPIRTLARLALLVEKGVPVEMFGGNHDRWGGSFWAGDLGIPFHSDDALMSLAGRQAWVHHGDGLAEATLGGRLLHRLTRSRIVIGAFRAIHPDFGLRLVHRLSGVFADRTPAFMNGAADAQEQYARTLLKDRPEIQLALMAHTHRQRLVEVEPGRYYLNAGQWMTDRHYAVVEQDRIRTLTWPERPR